MALTDSRSHHFTHEIDKFNQLAHEWWNVDGKFKTLHQINPTRLEFIQRYVDLNHKNVIDIGCGGGILAEGLAKAGANVTAIDLAPQSIEIAKLHLYESQLQINYECMEIGKKAQLQPNFYSVLTCMEMLEHVPDPEYIISQCARLLCNNGIAFFSTLNRNFKSYTLGVVAAEYLLDLVPRGTHTYQQFIRPSELRRMLTQHQLEIIDLQGLDYNPFTTRCKLTPNTEINYLVACRKSC